MSEKVIAEIIEKLKSSDCKESIEKYEIKSPIKISATKRSSHRMGWHLFRAQKE